MLDPKNNHIIEFLEYYTSLPISPHYAVMLRGKWGSGKSWFVKRFMTNHPAHRYLYLSLYGVTSFKEIEEGFFQQLHPVLASKGMKLVSAILKGVVKTTIKVDLNNDGKEDGSVTSGVPDIRLPDFLRNLDDRILIFDDLERCSIPIPSILGYINQFVEQGGLKVILIANEEEIINQDEKIGNAQNATAYLTIKEKLVGKSFDVQSDFDAALDEFIREINDPECQDLVQENKINIKEIYDIAGYQNLRHLRQSVLDYERFNKLLPNIAFQKGEVIEHIIKLFFSLSFEIKKGFIKEEEIYQLFSLDFLSSKSDRKTNAQLVKQKYPVYGLFYHPITHSAFSSFLQFGKIDKDEVAKSISNSTYFESERTPDWVKLWHYFEMQDDDFAVIINKVYYDFKHLEFIDKHVIVHVAGLLMKLVDDKLLLVPKEDILKLAKENVDNLNEKGLLALDKNETFPSEHSHGLGWQGVGMPEFDDLLDYARQQAITVKHSNYPKLAEELIQLMGISIDELEAKITLSNYSSSDYYDVPILSHMDADKFAAAFFRLKNKAKRELGRVIVRRYSYDDINKKLRDELPWLEKVKSVVNELNADHEGKVSGYLTERTFLTSLSTVIKKLTDLDKSTTE